MNALLIGTSLVTLLLAMPASSQVDLATIDLGALTQDDDRITKFISCFLEESACGEEELKAKAVICDAFQSRCEGCTQERKDQIKKLCMYLKTNRSEDWQKLMVKYDPTGERQKIWKEILA